MHDRSNKFHPLDRFRDIQPQDINWFILSVGFTALKAL